MSKPGQPPDDEPAVLVHDDFVSAAQAAQLLGLDSRTVRRRAADFAGRFIGGRWLFPRKAILDFAEWQRDAG
ncbi:helix-turn-helix domain-containing protein [Mycobacterium marinum]|uniref:helix-turn-helix domain-containing protein n=1 Tax=Mycobacterium marinum TaxID=1781 RepID=UPI0023592BA1|nr:helix-turn-helix domain-containing protein [Mycobacterium marinum]MDC8970836.1 helix-turn-helix domain-containing protein [Mycobacterium marinum]